MFKPFFLLQALLFTLFSFQTNAAENYCVGIRGNGENVSAHWPALARMVEEKGMPKTMAGGSSATVSMFLLESIAQNPTALAESNPRLKKEMQALLLKSIPFYIGTTFEAGRLTALFRMVLGERCEEEDFECIEEKKKEAEEGKKKNKILEMFNKHFSTPEDIDKFIKNMQVFGNLINPTLIARFKENPLFFKNEIIDGLKIFGKFDAKTDKNLFLRHSLIDFKFFALLIGQIADFYAGHASLNPNTQKRISQKLANFLKACAPESRGLPLEQVLAKPTSSEDTLCEDLLLDAIGSHISQDYRYMAHTRVFQPVGTTITAYPTTTVITNGGFEKYTKLLSEYNQGKEQPEKYENFSINFDTDLQYGYWGDSAQLQSINKKLKRDFPNDLKSSKFFALGKANWFEVLSSSPAEPGLANIQPIMHKTTRQSVLSDFMQSSFLNRWESLPRREGMLSAGGWSDLHPTLVLRASGCEKVVYLTRQNGESVFGQQVFVRLTGTTEQVPFWKEIRAKNRIGWSISELRMKYPRTINTPWNRLYNLGNPNSSFKRSIREADVVYCTDWDNFNLFAETYQDSVENIASMHQDSYTAPTFLKKGTSPSWMLNNVADYNDRRADGFPGCR